MNFRPIEGVGNAGCPPHPQPRVRNKIKHTSMVTTVTAGFTRHSRTRMVLTAYFVLSPVTGLVCHRHQADMAQSARSGRHASAGLDASVGASGPHVYILAFGETRRN